MHGRGLKLGSFVPLMSFNNLISGIFEKIFFSIFMGMQGFQIAESIPKNLQINLYHTLFESYITYGFHARQQIE